MRRRSTHRRGSPRAMKSSSGSVRQRRGRSSRGAPTAPAVSECSSAGSLARSRRIASISCSWWTKAARRACGTLRSPPTASVGAAERVLKQSDPNIRAFNLSPDGSTLAYSIQEADGRLNAFLTDFPAGNRQLQVTTSGGGPPAVLERWESPLLSGAGHAADRSPTRRDGGETDHVEAIGHVRAPGAALRRGQGAAGRHHLRCSTSRAMDAC